uniref:Uncharacterized protein n=1 Tax=Arundo donax TaxID=35708 RepID=A0A0A9CVF0_ARUDO
MIMEPSLFTVPIHTTISTPPMAFNVINNNYVLPCVKLSFLAYFHYLSILPIIGILVHSLALVGDHLVCSAMVRCPLLFRLNTVLNWQATTFCTTLVASACQLGIL